MIKKRIVAFMVLALAGVAWLLFFFTDVATVDLKPKMSLQLVAAVFLSVIGLFLFLVYHKNILQKTIFGFVMSIILFLLVVNIFVAESTSIHLSKNSKSTLDYFLSSGGRKMESVTVDYSTYLSNFGSVYYDMFKGKQVVLDSNLVNDPRVKPLQEMIASVSILEDLDISVTQKYMNGKKPQIIRHYDAEKNEQDLLIYTGNDFEAANKIYIKKVNERIAILPEFLFIEYQMEDTRQEVPDEFNYFDVNIVIIEMNMDSTLDRILPETEPVWMFVYLLLFFICGLFVMLPIFLSNKLVDNNILILVSFFVGVLVQIFSIITIGAIGLSITVISVAIANAVIVVLCAVIVLKRYRGSYQLNLSPTNAITVLLVLGAIYYYSRNPSIFLSYDSYMNVLIGKKIAVQGSITPEAGRLAMFSLLSPILHAHASIFGVIFSNAIQPVLTVLGILSITYLQAQMFLEKRFSRLASYLYSGIAVLAVFTVPEAVISSAWVLNNLTIGIFYGLAILLVLQYRYRNEPVYAGLSIAMFLFISIARIEGGIFAVIFLTAILVLDIDQHFKQILASLILIVYFLMNLFFFVNVKQIEEGFWSFHKAAGSLFLITALACLILFEKYWTKILGKIVRRIDAVMISVLVIGIVALALIKPEKAFENIRNLYVNMLVGYYGILFFGVFVVFLIYVFYTNSLSSITRLLSVQIVGFILLVYFIMLFSTHSSRVGYGDSSCRMLLHILPLCSITMVQMISEIGGPGKVGR